MADVLGGVASFVEELVPGLADAGVEVHVALLGESTSSAAGRSPGAASCEVRPLALEWMADPWADVEASARWVEELICAHDPDVVHMNTFTPVPHRAAPVLLTVHSCVLSWWRAVRGEDAPPQWDRYRRLTTGALRCAAAVTTPSRALLDQLRAIHEELPPAHVVPNGVDLPTGTQVPSKGRATRVVYVGRLWDEAKNAQALVRAAELIEGEVELIGAGESPAGRDRVRVLGPLRRDAVLARLRAARVFAEPARYEPFGLAALEAARCGCALVLGDIASLREVWGSAATYVEPEDPDALAAAVNGLLANPERCTAAADAARERAQRYTRAAMVSGYLELLRQLARHSVPA